MPKPRQRLLPAEGLKLKVKRWLLSIDIILKILWQSIQFETLSNIWQISQPNIEALYPVRIHLVGWIEQDTHILHIIPHKKKKKLFILFWPLICRMKNVLYFNVQKLYRSQYLPLEKKINIIIFLSKKTNRKHLAGRTCEDSPGIGLEPKRKKKKVVWSTLSKWIG